MRKRRWPWIAAVAGIVGAVALAVVAAWMLLRPDALRDERAEVAAVQAVAAIGFGVGGVGTLMLFVRRQWLQERAHELDRERAALDRQAAEDNRVQADRQHERELAKAADERHDATERRITELYIAAAEQLGHDRAPVRLAALHALHRLGRNEADHRQVVIDIWCSYLRQPFTPPARFVTGPRGKDGPTWATADDGELAQTEPGTDIDPADQDYEVRATAQRLLIRHLKDPREGDDNTGEPPPIDPAGFWGPSSVDLTGANLINADFTGCWFPETTFAHTRFHGNTLFTGARFHGDTRFDEARFNGYAGFSRTRFHETAWFSGARFDGEVRFDTTLFTKHARFHRVRFGGPAFFDTATFTERAEFDRARFHNDAVFDGARFHALALFDRAQFHKDALFHDARFHGASVFHHAQFTDDAQFEGVLFNAVAGFLGVRFTRDAWFKEASFNGKAEFREAQIGEDAVLDRAIAVLDPVDDVAHTWPSGWVLEPDPDGDPGWGRLVERGARNPARQSNPRQTRMPVNP